jgi:hypothetical protein
MLRLICRFGRVPESGDFAGISKCSVEKFFCYHAVVGLITNQDDKLNLDLGFRKEQLMKFVNGRSAQSSFSKALNFFVEKVLFPLLGYDMATYDVGKSREKYIGFSLDTSREIMAAVSSGRKYFNLEVSQKRPGHFSGAELPTHDRKIKAEPASSPTFSDSFVDLSSDCLVSSSDMDVDTDSDLMLENGDHRRPPLFFSGKHITENASPIYNSHLFKAIGERSSLITMTNSGHDSDSSFFSAGAATMSSVSNRCSSATVSSSSSTSSQSALFDAAFGAVPARDAGLRGEPIGKLSSTPLAKRSSFSDGPNATAVTARATSTSLTADAPHVG